jgi:hypothetical protein
MLNIININHHEYEQEKQKQERGIKRTDHNITKPDESSGNADRTQGEKRLAQIEAPPWMA